MEDRRKLLTSKEAADYLGVSEGMLRLSRHTGELFKGIPGPPFLKMSKAVRYSKENLDAWIQRQGEYSSTAEAGAS